VYNHWSRWGSYQLENLIKVFVVRDFDWKIIRLFDMQHLDKPTDHNLFYLHTSKESKHIRGVFKKFCK